MRLVSLKTGAIIAIAFAAAPWLWAQEPSTTTKAEGIPPREFKEQLRWFAKEVMPAFR